MENLEEAVAQTYYQVKDIIGEIYSRGKSFLISLVKEINLYIDNNNK